MDAFIYQYAIGGAVFLVGLVYAWRQGYVSFEGRGLQTLAALCGGLAILMALQGYMQYGSMNTLPAVENTGTYSEKQQLGTPLDYGVIALYFLGILAIGTWFGRQQRTAKDFSSGASAFPGGSSHFPWWRPPSVPTASSNTAKWRINTESVVPKRT